MHDILRGGERGRRVGTVAPVPFHSTKQYISCLRHVFFHPTDYIYAMHHLSLSGIIYKNH